MTYSEAFAFKLLIDVCRWDVGASPDYIVLGTCLLILIFHPIQLLGEAAAEGLEVCMGLLPFCAATGSFTQQLSRDRLGREATLPPFLL